MRTIIWDGKAIGTITNVTNDMWYLDAVWTPNNSDKTLRFEKLASMLDAGEVIKNPTKGIIVTVKNQNSVLANENLLVLSLRGNELFLRLIRNETATWIEQNE